MNRKSQRIEAHAHSQALLSRLDKIEDAVKKLKAPASYADQFYNSRGHIPFVRASILQHAAAGGLKKFEGADVPGETPCTATETVAIPEPQKVGKVEG